MLDKDILFDALKTLGFTPDIDIFASRINTQFPHYVAYRPDPGAVAIDAFTNDWSRHNFYAFPPFSLLPLVLKKIKEDKASRICVLPNWPTQAWFSRQWIWQSKEQCCSNQAQIYFTCPINH
jgi:hypothetical protein